MACHLKDIAARLCWFWGVSVIVSCRTKIHCIIAESRGYNSISTFLGRKYTKLNFYVFRRIFTVKNASKAIVLLAYYTVLLDRSYLHPEKAELNHTEQFSTSFQLKCITSLCPTLKMIFTLQHRLVNGSRCTTVLVHDFWQVFCVSGVLPIANKNAQLFAIALNHGQLECASAQIARSNASGNFAH